MSRIVVEGESVLTGKLRGLKVNVERTQIYRHNKAMQPAFDLARRLVPVDTGYLKSTIRTEADAEEGRLIADADYAGYVEFGTSRMAAQPYLRPAAELVKTAGVTIIAADLKTRVVNYGN